ncbi:ArsR/SmtB family transcription factor [Streptomyces hokutonensis]|uniref:ArsR/SmtB family transcription factor n=1 Tax=Streptomyces hokutonensis TaxID=1306990 RepID=UPI0003A333A4|nr:helix-turn-helix domain-containing protein [Streptomyces hokutonensis]
MNTTDLDAGLDALLYTPKSSLRADLESFTLFTRRPVPGWAVDLADGSPRALEALSGAIRDWHQAAIAPMQQHLHTHAEAARLSAARTLLAEGLDAMFSRLHPTIRWTPPVLELARPELNEDFHLEGRGLHLVPSLFCRAPGITLHADLPVLAFPVSHNSVWTPEASLALEAQGGTLGALLGPTRAALLQAVVAGHGVTTNVLAHSAGISPATVSHHTTVLRDAGLITTHRTGTSAHHLPTPLGTQLVSGAPSRR